MTPVHTPPYPEDLPPTHMRAGTMTRRALTYLTGCLALGAIAILIAAVALWLLSTA